MSLLDTAAGTGELIEGIRAAVGAAAASKAEELLAAHAGRGRTPFQILYYAGDDVRVALEKATWHRRGYEVIQPVLDDIDAAAVARLGAQRIKDNLVVPLRDQRILMANPIDVSAQDVVRRVLGEDWVTVAADRASVVEILPGAIRLGGQNRLTDALARSSGPTAATSDEVVNASNSVTAQAVDEIIRQAIASRASDIHIEPVRNGALVRFRVDGMLRSSEKSGVDVKAIVNRIKIRANMDVAESQTAHDGRFDFAVPGGGKIDIRCVSLPSHHGESISLRLLDSSSALKSTTELGFAESIRSRLEDLMALSQGAVLATGPTGSGKTTTLYSMLSIVGEERKVVSVEDPVEYLVPGVSQHQVAPLRDFTFASALRSFLRADTDVMLVGEVRDTETAQTLMEASFTGHLVLSSLHASSAVSAPLRLIEMGASPYAVASGLVAVINQRLVRKLCTKCREATDGKRFRAAPMGCTRCGNTGYAGRIAIGELMIVDDGVSEAIGKGESVLAVRDAAAEQGMLDIRHDAMRHVDEGATSIEEVHRVLGKEEG